MAYCQDALFNFSLNIAKKGYIFTIMIDLWYSNIEISAVADNVQRDASISLPTVLGMLILAEPLKVLDRFSTPAGTEIGSCQGFSLFKKLLSFLRVKWSIWCNFVVNVYLAININTNYTRTTNHQTRNGVFFIFMVIYVYLCIY